LTFVAIAGVVAAATIELKTGLPQLVPSVLALALLFVSRKTERTKTGS